ncbi:MAG: hypothetical protein AB1600_00285 [Bacteroidota bacterium]
MTTYQIDLGSNQQVVSLLIDASAQCMISGIVHDVDPPEGVYPVDETTPSLPLIVNAGYTKINLARPLTARTIELVGAGLEHIRAVIINNLTVEVNQTIHARAAGTIDGANKTFTSPFPFTTVLVNGIAQIQNEHYTKINSTTFELNDAPLTGDTVSIIYIT